MNDKRIIFNKISVVFIICIVCCFLWGSAFPFVKIGYSVLKISNNDTPSILLFAGIRFFLSGVFTIIIGSILSKKFIYPKKENCFNVFKLSLVQTVLQYIFFYIGLSNTTGVKSSVINGSSSFFAVIIACFVFRYERFNIYKLFGCILGFSGIILINLDGSFLDLNFTFLGEGFVLLSAIFYAFSSSMIKKYSYKESPIVLSGYQFAIGGSILIIISLLFGGKFSYISLVGIILIVYLGILSAIAYSLWGIVLKYNTVSRITVFGFMIPVFGFFLSTLILNETYSISILSILALLLVCSGIFVVNRFNDNKI